MKYRRTRIMKIMDLFRNNPHTVALCRVLEAGPSKRQLPCILKILNEAAWTKGIFDIYDNDLTNLEGLVIEPCEDPDSPIKKTILFQAMSDLCDLLPFMRRYVPGISDEIIGMLVDDKAPIEPIAIKIDNPYLDFEKIVRTDSPGNPIQVKIRIAQIRRFLERLRNACPTFPELEGKESEKIENGEIENDEKRKLDVLYRLIGELQALIRGSDDGITHNSATLCRAIDRVEKESAFDQSRASPERKRLFEIARTLIYRLKSDLGDGFDRLNTMLPMDVAMDAFPPQEPVFVFPRIERRYTSRAVRVLEQADSESSDGALNIILHKDRYGWSGLDRAVLEPKSLGDVLDYLVYGLSKEDAAKKLVKLGLENAVSVAVNTRSKDAFQALMEMNPDSDLGGVAIDARWAEGIETLLDLGIEPREKFSGCSAVEAWLDGGGRDAKVLEKLLKYDPEALYEPDKNEIGGQGSPLDRIFRFKDPEVLKLLMPYIDPERPSHSFPDRPIWHGMFHRSGSTDLSEFLESVGNAMNIYIAYREKKGMDDSERSKIRDATIASLGKKLGSKILSLVPGLRKRSRPIYSISEPGL